MKRIKSWELFEINRESKIKEFDILESRKINNIRGLINKGTDFTSNALRLIRREKEETKIAFSILRRMIKGIEVSEGEKKFLKEHSKDLLKIIPLVLLQGVPVPIPLATILVILGRKFGIDFIPRDHRYLLDNDNI